MKNEIETDLFATAIHECSHFIASAHFRIGAGPKVYTRNSPDGTVIGGITEFEFQPNKLINCVISISGVLGEDLTGHRRLSRSVPPFDPRTHLRDWFCWLLGTGQRELSESDQSGINALKNPWPACQRAFKIVSKNSDRILELAALVVAAQKKTKQEANERDPNHWKNAFPGLAEAADSWNTKVEKARRELGKDFTFEKLHENQ